MISSAKTLPVFLELLCKKGRSNETTPNSCFCLFLWHKQLWMQYLFAHQEFHSGRIFQLLVYVCVFLLNSVTGTFMCKAFATIDMCTLSSLHLLLIRSYLQFLGTHRTHGWGSSITQTFVAWLTGEKGGQGEAHQYGMGP